MRQLLSYFRQLCELVGKLSIVIAMALILVFITLGSLYFMNESRIVPTLNPVNIFATIAALGIVIAVFYMYHHTKLLKLATSSNQLPRNVLVWSLILVMLSGLVVVLVSQPNLVHLYDSEVLLRIARGDIDTGYLSIYPHQIPLALFMRFLGYMTSSQGVVTLFAILNIASVALITYSIHHLARLLTKNNTVVIVATILTVTFLPFLYYIPHIYGDLIGVALSLYGIYCLFAWIESKRWLYLIACMPLFSIALLIKTNTSLIIALLITMIVVYALYTKTMRILLAAAALSVAFIVQTAVMSFGKQYFAIDTSRELPKTMWVAMGLKYGDRDSAEIAPQKITPGTWSPGITGGTVMRETSKRTNENATTYTTDVIRQELAVFLYHPLYAAEFFTQKIIASWNNQSFEGPDRLGYQQKTVKPDIFNNSSSTSKTFKWIQKIHQQLIYILAFIGLYAFLKRKIDIDRPLAYTIISLFISLFSLSMLWEVMSRTVLLSYVLLFPFAGIGTTLLVQKSHRPKP